MSVPRSQLVAEVYEYCGNPDDRPLKENGLPQPLVFQVLTECEDEMLRDLDLSNQNRRIAKIEGPLSSGLTEFSLLEEGVASYVALQTDPSSDLWQPVEIVNHGSLLQASNDGRLAIAFYGTPSVGEISWLPESAHTLRIWYDRTGNDAPTLSESTEIGNLYDSYLKLRTAAQCRELLGLDVGKVLSTRLLNSERQWKRYVNTSRQQGTASKPFVFTPPRLRRRYPLLDPTRFYLPR